MTAEKPKGDIPDERVPGYLIKSSHFQKLVARGDIESLCRIINSDDELSGDRWVAMTRLPRAVMNAAKGGAEAQMHAAYISLKNRGSDASGHDIYSRMQILNDCEYLSPESRQSLFTLAATSEAASAPSGDDRAEQAFNEAFNCVLDDVSYVKFKEKSVRELLEELSTNPLQGDGVLGKRHPKTEKQPQKVRFPRLRRLFKRR